MVKKEVAVAVRIKVKLRNKREKNDKVEKTRGYFLAK